MNYVTSKVQLDTKVYAEQELNVVQLWFNFNEDLFGSF